MFLGDLFDEVDGSVVFVQLTLQLLKRSHQTLIITVWVSIKHAETHGSWRQRVKNQPIWPNDHPSVPISMLVSPQLLMSYLILQLLLNPWTVDLIRNVENLYWSATLTDVLPIRPFEEMRQPLPALRSYKFGDVDVDHMQGVVSGSVEVDQALDDVLDDIGYIGGKHLFANAGCFFDSPVFHIPSADDLTQLIKGLSDQRRLLHSSDEIVLDRSSRPILRILSEEQNLVSEDSLLFVMELEVVGQEVEVADHEAFGYSEH